MPVVRLSLSEVGTYGKQLGAIGDVLRILIKHIRPEDLEPEEKKALTALQLQLDEIDRLKARHVPERASLRP